ncbi:hypothetical protein [Bradyrhizobium sp. WSM471]|uniref:hypothetical protein n=1 Tax=Bradyrhizobium sp. WSM471 TaxID=319017 RepID=UPI0012F750F8|nr:MULTISPECIES: hypothetical protein [Bradyrhizobium]UFW43407.1 hypothetical protein BcanWSM471_10110 [Bradyrhizobium canariense]
MSPIKFLALPLILLTVQEASAGDWEVFGLKARMSVMDAVPIMAGACASNIETLQPLAPVENLDRRICTRADGSSLEVWFRCGKLFAAFVRKKIEGGNAATGTVLQDCGRETNIETLGERRISLSCDGNGSVTIEFPQVGERLSLTRNYYALSGPTCP